MRQMFANRRPAVFIALGVAVLLVAILVILGGRALLGGTTEQGARDTTPDTKYFKDIIEECHHQDTYD